MTWSEHLAEQAMRNCCTGCEKMLNITEQGAEESYGKYRRIGQLTGGEREVKWKISSVHQ